MESNIALEKIRNANELSNSLYFESASNEEKNTTLFLCTADGIISVKLKAPGGNVINKRVIKGDLLLVSKEDKHIIYIGRIRKSSNNINSPDAANDGCK